MKKWIIVLLLILTLFEAAQAKYLEDYIASPQIRPGSYATYRIYYHPTIERVKITILEKPNNTTLRIQVTLEFVDKTTTNYTLQYDVSLMRSIPIGAGRDLPYPIIAKDMQKRDYVTLTDKIQSGVTITRIGGDIWNYSYRKMVFHESQGLSLTWDSETGLLVKAVKGDPFSGEILLLAELEATNLWGTPLSKLPNPVAIPEIVIGVLFSHWEIWVVIIGGIVFMLVKDWLFSLFTSLRDLRRDREMAYLYSEVMEQKRRVKVIR